MDDLREVIGKLEKCDELRRVTVTVDPILEIAAITARICRTQHPRALLFESVQGYDMPVITNLFGSISRVERAIGCRKSNLAENRFNHDLRYSQGRTAEQRLLTLLNRQGETKIEIEIASCQELIETDNCDLEAIPALKSWSGDGGRYLTLGQVFTRLPDGSSTNCGMYRVQIVNSRNALIHWGTRADAARHFQVWQGSNKPMPIAIALGGPPALTLVAGMPLPPGIDEVAFAAYLRQQPLAMTRCVTNELQVPASAELVVEGWVDPQSTALEGPFGNHTGYYVDAGFAPIIQVSAITRRLDAILPATVVGPPPMEDCFLAKFAERLILPMVRIDFPAVGDIDFPVEGIFHGGALIALARGAEGQGRALLEQLWQSGWLQHCRMLVIFNADVDIHNYSEVYWRALNHVQADRDVYVDGQRLGIDASVPPGQRSLAVDPATVRLLERRWTEYGI